MRKTIEIFSIPGTEESCRGCVFVHGEMVAGIYCHGTQASLGVNCNDPAAPVVFVTDATPKVLVKALPAEPLKPMREEDLVRAFREFVMSQDDDRENEWYCTHREMASNLMAEFAAHIGVDVSFDDLVGD